MANVETYPGPSEPSSTHPLGRPYEYKPVRAPQRPAPKTAFGFILDTECRLRWARWYCELTYGDKLSRLSPQEVDDELEEIELVSSWILPGLIYAEFPTLPRLRNRLLPVVDGLVVPEHYIFVLRDDATWLGMNAPLDASLIEAVGRRLGVPGQQPNWYKIDAYVRITLVTHLSSSC